MQLTFNWLQPWLVCRPCELGDGFDRTGHPLFFDYPWGTIELITLSSSKNNQSLFRLIVWNEYGRRPASLVSGQRCRPLWIISVGQYTKWPSCLTQDELISNQNWCDEAAGGSSVLGPLLWMVTLFAPYFCPIVAPSTPPAARVTSILLWLLMFWVPPTNTQVIIHYPFVFGSIENHGLFNGATEYFNIIYQFVSKIPRPTIHRQIYKTWSPT